MPKASLLNEQKFQQKPETRYLVFGIWLTQERMGHAYYPSWLLMSPSTQPFLCFIPVTALGASQGGLPPHRVWKHPSSPKCTQPASKPRALRERGRCSWQRWFILEEVFSLEQRHAVPWMMHSNGIAAIKENSFFDVRKELWNSVSKIREKFLRQPDSFGEHVTNNCPSCEQNKQWHYKSQDYCAVCPYLTSLKSEKYKNLGN